MQSLVPGTQEKNTDFVNFLVQGQAKIAERGAIHRKWQNHGEIPTRSGAAETAVFAPKGTEDVAATIGIS